MRLNVWLYIFFVFLHIQFSQSNAQDRCASEVYGKYLADKDPTLTKKRELGLLQMRKKLSEMRISSNEISGKIYRIPVVVHVIWNTNESNITDDMVLSQIRTLNEDYGKLNSDTIKTPDKFKSLAANTGFQFFLSGIDPQGNSSNGIVRKYSSVSAYSPTEVDQNLKPLSFWPSDQYLNIWVTSLTNGYIGIGPYPDDVFGNTSDSVTDGIVIDYRAFGKNSYKYNLGRTTTHEIGHWLGLIHIWGNSNAQCGDDMINDTPVQQTDNQYMKSTCPAHISTCNNVSSEDMSENYMDYSPDQCMNIFTRDQATRMQEVMQSNHLRISIQTSPALTVTATNSGNTMHEHLKLFPNPAKNNLAIQLENYIGSAEILITNTLGLLVYQKIADNSDWQIDLSHLSNGIYFLRMIVEGQVEYQKKFIKIE